METLRVHRPMFTLIKVSSIIATMILISVQTVKKGCAVCMDFLFAFLAVGCSNRYRIYGNAIQGGGT